MGGNISGKKMAIELFNSKIQHNKHVKETLNDVYEIILIIFSYGELCQTC